MKILIFGFLTFFAWAAVSAHIYVCMIKGFCYIPKNMRTDMVDAKKAIVNASKLKTISLKHTELPEKQVIYFAYNKSEFNSNAEIDEYIEQSNMYLIENLQASLNITGFTDLIGTREYNQDLGYQRAQSIQHYFISKGILANRIVVESKGELFPTDNNNTTKGRANNRRTVITLKK